MEAREGVGAAAMAEVAAVALARAVHVATVANQGPVAEVERDREMVGAMAVELAGGAVMAMAAEQEAAMATASWVEVARVAAAREMVAVERERVAVARGAAAKEKAEAARAKVAAARETVVVAVWAGEVAAREEAKAAAQEARAAQAEGR